MILLKRLKECIKVTRNFESRQAGFIKEVGCSLTLLLLSLLKLRAAHNKEKIYMASIDFEKAFDSIDRDLLWKKFKSKGCTIDLLLAIKDLYSGTNRQIKIDQQGNLTEKIETAKELKQGCLLAPTLFNFFICS
ncbi:uncharacterized protein [Ambystoma mexicanum]|uniref:uncharacterized protein n=1 Tax=Ambystoma mexicanum TaxID=8296 RepID=UPI0037E97058